MHIIFNFNSPLYNSNLYLRNSNLHLRNTYNHPHNIIFLTQIPFVCECFLCEFMCLSETMVYKDISSTNCLVSSYTLVDRDCYKYFFSILNNALLIHSSMVSLAT